MAPNQPAEWGTDPTDLKIEKALLDDPLSQTTRRDRRALLVVAAVAVGSSIWNLSVGRISAIDMEIPDGAQKSVLLTALAYLAVTFVWHFFQDRARWTMNSYVVSLTDVYQMIKKTPTALKSIEDGLAQSQATAGDPSASAIIEMCDTVTKTLNEQREVLGKIQTQRNRMIRDRRWSLWVWEFGLPVAATAVAFASLVGWIKYS